MTAYLRLLRPKHAVKNGFIALPAFFAGVLGETEVLVPVAVAILAFSLAAGAVYTLNDLLDVEADRRHPVKRQRPIAAGEVPVGGAVALFAVALLAGVGLMGWVGPEALIWIGIYLVLNGAYSVRLKHVPILDMAIVSFGFVLRVLVGGVAAGVPVSEWLVVMTFLLALFIAMAKRRDDVLILERTGESMRRVVDGYNLRFLDGGMTVMASVVVVAYLSYCLSPDVEARIGSEHVYLTAFFVVIGILRYMQVTWVEERSGSPTQLVWEDRFLQFVIAGWAGTFAWLLYGA